MTLKWVSTYPADADTIAYMQAVETADGQALELDVIKAYDAFILGCKHDGIWDAIKASCILAGARTLDGALVPLKGGAPTNNNFVAGDYNRKTGLVGDGSTKYLDSNRNNNTDPQDNAHISIYQTVQNTTGGSRGLMGSRTLVGGIRTTQINITSGNSWAVQIRNNNPNNFTGSISGAQFVGGTRSSSTNETRRDGGVNTTYAATSLAPVNLNHFIFAMNQDGSPITLTNARIAFYSIGESLDLALLDNRISTLMTTLNTVLP